MALTLVRRYFTSGTNGTLFINGQEICKTIELPWNHNQRRISCIPEGNYQIRKRFSHKFKWHLELLNVKNRSLILIHPANHAMKELNGCIAPVSEITGEGQGSRSRLAFDKLKDMVFPYLESGFVIKLTIKKSI